MSFRRIDVPLPKNGRRYRGVAVCRISTEMQNEMSLDDQGALYRERLPDYIKGEYDLEVMATQGSGELLDREEFIELCEKVASGDYDFVIAEDLGRIARRLQVMILCEDAEDSETRIFAINDRVDTLDTESWRQNAFFATMRHESYNRDTSNRIKRSHRNRFSNGDMVRQLPAGYIKPHAGATEAECSKAPGAQVVYEEWFDRLENGESFADIAIWLNSIEFPLGMSVKKTEWDGTLVGQTTRNPILKGLREHNRRTAVRVNRTGRRKSVAAAPELLMRRECPQLAFIDAERYDRVIRMLALRNEKFTKGITKANGGRGRHQGTRNDARWPSQHVRCGICGRKFVLGGHGRKDRMMCDGARQYRCWNAMTVDAEELARAVSDEVHRQIALLPYFDDKLIRQVQAEASELASQRNGVLAELQKRRVKVDTEVSNLAEAIAGGISSPALLKRLQEAEKQLTEIDDQICDAVRTMRKAVVVPRADELRQRAIDATRRLTVTDRKFGRLMRAVISDFYILPYRLIDGGMISPRSVFRVNFGAIDGIDLPPNLDWLSTDCLVDLTVSPQRVEFRERVVQLRESGKTERETAEELGITHTAAQRAAKLDREMRQFGLTDPWQPVRSDQDAADCYARIANPRYDFKPLHGFTAKFPNPQD